MCESGGAQIESNGMRGGGGCANRLGKSWAPGRPKGPGRRKTLRLVTFSLVRFLSSSAQFPTFGGNRIHKSLKCGRCNLVSRVGAEEAFFPAVVHMRAGWKVNLFFHKLDSQVTEASSSSCGLDANTERAPSSLEEKVYLLRTLLRTSICMV